MEGDPLVDRLMKPVIATIEHYVKNQAGVIAIYNRAYEAVMNSMVVLDTMRDQLSKANAHAEEAEKFAALKQERCAELELRLDAYNGNMIDTLQARAEAAEALEADLRDLIQQLVEKRWDAPIACQELWDKAIRVGKRKKGGE